MKNIGLDIQLLRIGLQYAQLRATGDNFLHLFDNKHKDEVKTEVDPKNYQNVTYLHAMVIFLKKYIFALISSTFHISDKSKTKSNRAFKIV